MIKSLLSTLFCILFEVMGALVVSYIEDSIFPLKLFPVFLVLAMSVACFCLLVRKNVKLGMVELGAVKSTRQIKRRWIFLVDVVLVGIAIFDLWWIGFPAASLLGFIFFQVWCANGKLSEVVCTVFSACVAGVLVGFCAMTQVRTLPAEQLENVARQEFSSKADKGTCSSDVDIQFVRQIAESIGEQSFSLTKEKYDRFQQLLKNCPSDFEGLAAGIENQRKSLEVFWGELLESMRLGKVVLSDETRKGLKSSFDERKEIIQEFLELGYLDFNDHFYLLNDTNDVLKLLDSYREKWKYAEAAFDSLLNPNLVGLKTDSALVAEQKALADAGLESVKRNRGKRCSQKDSVLFAEMVDGLFENDFGIDKKRHRWFQGMYKNCPEIMGVSGDLRESISVRLSRRLKFYNDMVVSMAGNSLYVSDERKAGVSPENLSRDNELIQRYLNRDTIHPKNPKSEPFVPDVAYVVKLRKAQIKISRRYLMRLDSLLDENLYK